MRWKMETTTVLFSLGTHGNMRVASRGVRGGRWRRIATDLPAGIVGESRDLHPELGSTGPWRCTFVEAAAARAWPWTVLAVSAASGKLDGKTFVHEFGTIFWAKPTVSVTPSRRCKPRDDMREGGFDVRKAVEEGSRLVFEVCLQEGRGGGTTRGSSTYLERRHGRPSGPCIR